jgi:hypothetical protein
MLLHPCLVFGPPMVNHISKNGWHFSCLTHKHETWASKKMWETRVTWPITDHLLVTEHFGMADLSQFFSILSVLKCYRSNFSSSTNHLWNEKSKDQ